MHTLYLKRIIGVVLDQIDYFSCFQALVEIWGLKISIAELQISKWKGLPLPTITTRLEEPLLPQNLQEMISTRVFQTLTWYPLKFTN